MNESLQRRGAGAREPAAARPARQSCLSPRLRCPARLRGGAACLQVLRWRRAVGRRGRCPPGARRGARRATVRRQEGAQAVRWTGVAGRVGSAVDGAHLSKCGTLVKDLHLGWAGVQLPGISDVSQRKGTRANHATQSQTRPPHHFAEPHRACGHQDGRHHFCPWWNSQHRQRSPPAHQACTRATQHEWLLTRAALLGTGHPPPTTTDRKVRATAHPAPGSRATQRRVCVSHRQAPAHSRSDVPAHSPHC